VRIVGGRYRGLALTPLGKGDPASALRPTSDRVRESLFNVLEHNPDVVELESARVLDIFAGTGALGLEALSRGADHVTFVENGRIALGLLKSNIAKTKSEAETQILARDARRIGPNQNPPFDLVFLDPPYGKSLGTQVLEDFVADGWIALGATLAWEENAPQHPPEGFELIDHRHYGDTVITLLTYSRGS